MIGGVSGSVHRELRDGEQTRCGSVSLRQMACSEGASSTQRTEGAGHVAGPAGELSDVVQRPYFALPVARLRGDLRMLSSARAWAPSPRSASSRSAVASQVVGRARVASGFRSA